MNWKVIKVDKYEWHRWFAWYPVTVEHEELKQDGEVYKIERKAWLKTVWRKDWVTQWDCGFNCKET